MRAPFSGTVLGRPNSLGRTLERARLLATLSFQHDLDGRPSSVPWISRHTILLDL
jgi:hypothetical protein